nr:unnamed protein product [Callosobruchus analis]
MTNKGNTNGAEFFGPQMGIGRYAERYINTPLINGIIANIKPGVVAGQAESPDKNGKTISHNYENKNVNGRNIGKNGGSGMSNVRGHGFMGGIGPTGFDTNKLYDIENGLTGNNLRSIDGSLDHIENVEMMGNNLEHTM